MKVVNLLNHNRISCSDRFQPCPLNLVFTETPSQWAPDKVQCTTTDIDMGCVAEYSRYQYINNKITLKIKQSQSQYTNEY